MMKADREHGVILVNLSVCQRRTLRLETVYTAAKASPRADRTLSGRILPKSDPARVPKVHPIQGMVVSPAKKASPTLCSDKYCQGWLLDF